MAIDRRVKSENNGLGSPKSVVCMGARQGGPIIFCTGTPGWVSFSALFAGVVQSSCVFGDPPRGRGESYHFCTRTPSCIEGVGWATSCGYRSLGRRVVTIGHWKGGLNRKITGSVVQSSCVSGARQEVRRVISFLNKNFPHVYY